LYPQPVTFLLRLMDGNQKDIPNYVLVKDSIVRCSSTYLMLFSISQNKDILTTMSQAGDIVGFTPHEYAVIDEVIKVLAVLHSATLQIECRCCSISKYIPIVLTIIRDFENPNAGKKRSENNYRFDGV